MITTEQKLAALQEQSCVVELDGLLSRTESPVEALAVASLLCDGWTSTTVTEHFHWYTDIGDTTPTSPDGCEGVVRLQPRYTTAQLAKLPPQAKRRLSALGRFRPDLLWFADENRRALIEIDGHAFHERTKRQAAHDKARDRDLMSPGWPVYRFTGSEVWSDPYCVAHLIRKLSNSVYE